MPTSSESVDHCSDNMWACVCPIRRWLRLCLWGRPCCCRRWERGWSSFTPCCLRALTDGRVSPKDRYPTLPDTQIEMPSYFLKRGFNISSSEHFWFNGSSKAWSSISGCFLFYFVIVSGDINVENWATNLICKDVVFHIALISLKGADIR